MSYSSPAAAALSVQSMPPTMVASANGTTTGSFSSASSMTGRHQSNPRSQNGSIASGRQLIVAAPRSTALTTCQPAKRLSPSQSK